MAASPVATATCVYTALSFAPVQGFISSSRKLRDLYGSSLLLSHLARSIVDDATERLGAKAVISPALVHTSRGTPNLLVIAGDYKRGWGRDALLAAWGEVLDACRGWIEDEIPGPYEWQSSWQQWQQHAWEYFHAQGESIAVARAGVPSSGVNPPAPPPRRSRGGARTSGDRLSGWRCKGWAGPFPWFENHLNQTNHAQDPLCRT